MNCTLTKTTVNRSEAGYRKMALFEVWGHNNELTKAKDLARFLPLLGTTQDGSAWKSRIGFYWGIIGRACLT